MSAGTLILKEEWESLISQIATSKGGRGGRRKLPSAFTEHGAVMAANVLNSPVAVRASIAVVRAFVRLRQLLVSHEELARKLDALEKKFEKHDHSLGLSLTRFVSSWHHHRLRDEESGLRQSRGVATHPAELGEQERRESQNAMRQLRLG